MKKFWRWFTNRHCAGDHFRLETHRIVEIDGHEMITKGFSGDGSWDNLNRLSVDFEPWYGPKKA